MDYKKLLAPVGATLMLVAPAAAFGAGTSVTIRVEGLNKTLPDGRAHAQRMDHALRRPQR